MGSIPEPSPVNSGKIVTISLIKWINRSDFSPLVKLEATKLISDRRLYGINKYHQELMTNDGRNSVEDAKQELGDLIQYIYKAKMNQEDLSEIKLLLIVLIELLNI